jgi:hypothetical protein
VQSCECSGTTQLRQSPAAQLGWPVAWSHIEVKAKVVEMAVGICPVHGLISFSEHFAIKRIALLHVAALKALLKPTHALLT